MRYLFCLMFLIGSYILPYLICYNLAIWIDKNEEASLGTVLLLYLSYLLLYVLRFFAFIFMALISFCLKNCFMYLYKYNSLIFLILFIIDMILYNTLDSIFGIDFYKAHGFLLFIVFLSFTSTYFPFWLVFGLRNLMHFVKNKNKAMKIEDKQSVS